MILTWWLDALHAIRVGKAAEAECLFMEGPYLFVVRPAASAWHLHALDDGEAIHVEVIDPNALWESVVAAGRLLLGECQARDWRNRDIVALSQTLRRAASGGAA